jgi:MSHA biogenesis protein MshL
MKVRTHNILVWGSLLTFLGGCDTHRIEESHKKNLSDMQEALREGSKVPTPEEENLILDASLDVLKDLGPKMDMDVAEDALRCNLVVNQEDPSNFFSMLSQTYEVGIVMDKDLKDPITLSLTNASIKEVFQALQEGYGIEFEKTSYGYRVAKPKLETKIFIINYLDIKRKGSSSTSINPSSSMSGSGSGTNTGNSGSNRQGHGRSGSQVTTEMDAKFWEDLEQTIGLLLADTKIPGAIQQMQVSDGDKEKDKGKEKEQGIQSNAPSSIINRNTGLVVVRGYRDQLAKIQDYLYRTQLIVKRQVILETKILDVELNDQYATGINWTNLGGSVFASNSKFSTNIASGKNITTMQLSNTGSPFGNAIALTATKGTTFSAVMNLLSHQGKVSVLSSPRISVINNQKAVIKVGTDSYYPTNTSSNAVASAGGTTTGNSISMTPFFSGISMDVTPQISDNEEISLHVHPVISRVESEKKEFQIDDKTTQFSTAKTTVREADTIVNAKSDQVVIIGGLMENNIDLENYGLPVKDRTGLLNSVFGQKGGSKVNRELVILLKPIVVKNDTWANEIKKTMQSAFQG